jgi:uncharacterized protein YuzE
MKISYDPSVDALYIRFVDHKVESEVIRINDCVAVDFGPGDQVVGLEVVDASELLKGRREGRVRLDNLTAA